VASFFPRLRKLSIFLALLISSRFPFESQVVASLHVRTTTNNTSNKWFILPILGAPRRCGPRLLKLSIFLALLESSRFHKGSQAVASLHFRATNNGMSNKGFIWPILGAPKRSGPRLLTLSIFLALLINSRFRLSKQAVASPHLRATNNGTSNEGFIWPILRAPRKSGTRLLKLSIFLALPESSRFPLGSQAVASPHLRVTKNGTSNMRFIWPILGAPRRSGPRLLKLASFQALLISSRFPLGSQAVASPHLRATNNTKSKRGLSGLFWVPLEGVVLYC